MSVQWLLSAVILPQRGQSSINRALIVLNRALPDNPILDKDKNIRIHKDKVLDKVQLQREVGLQLPRRGADVEHLFQLRNSAL
jgi:hypothetical protein